MKKNKRGFTLIELLVTIVIITLLLLIGITVIVNLIKNKNDTATLITESNIKKAAINYSLESDNIVWLKLEDTDSEYTCTTIQRLVNKGYLKNNLVDAETKEPIPLNQFIKIIRDNYKVITSSELNDIDDATICDNKEIPFTITIDGPNKLLNNETWYYDKVDEKTTFKIDIGEAGVSGIKNKGVRIYNSDKNEKIHIDFTTVYGNEYINSFSDLFKENNIKESEIEKFGKNIKVCVTITNGNDISHEECKTINADFVIPATPSIEICEARNKNCTEYEEQKWYKGGSFLKLSGGGNSPSGIMYKYKKGDIDTEIGIQKSEPYIKNIITSDKYSIKTCNNVGNCSDYKVVDLKIDNTSPKITYFEKSSNSYLKSLTLMAGFIDEESGVTKWKISKDSEYVSTGWNTISSVQTEINKTKEITSNGTWYIWVEDVVGEVSSESIIIDNIDNIKPVCVWPSNETWTKGPIELTYGCSDESGCDSEFSGKTISYGYGTSIKTAKTTSFEYTIKDNAGNQKNCTSDSVSIYVDNELPTVVVTEVKSNDDNDSSSVGVKYSATDGYSGLKQYCITSSLSTESINSSKCAEWNFLVSSTLSISNTTPLDYNIPNAVPGTSYKIYVFWKDVAGNENSNYRTYTVPVVDSTPPTCVWPSNTTWTKGPIQLTYGCSDESGCTSGYSGKTISYGYGTSITTAKTTSVEYTIKDNAGNTKNCKNDSVSVYVDNKVPSVSMGTVTSGSDDNEAIVNFSISASDEHSGVKEYCVTSSISTTSLSYSNCSSWETLSTSNPSLSVNSYSYVIPNAAGGTTYRIYVFFKDSVGNVNSYNRTYTVPESLPLYMCSLLDGADIVKIDSCSDGMCNVYYNEDSKFTISQDELINVDDSSCDPYYKCNTESVSVLYCDDDGYCYYEDYYGDEHETRWYNFYDNEEKRLICEEEEEMPLYMCSQKNGDDIVQIESCDDDQCKVFDGTDDWKIYKDNLYDVSYCTPYYKCNDRVESIEYCEDDGYCSFVTDTGSSRYKYFDVFYDDYEYDYYCEEDDDPVLPDDPFVDEEPDINWERRKMNGKWVIYKNDKYILEIGSTDDVIYNLANGSQIADGTSTFYNVLENYVVGQLDDETIVYIDADNKLSSNYGENFVVIYVKSNQVNKNAFNACSSYNSVSSCAAGSVTINGSTYYKVYVVHKQYGKYSLNCISGEACS